MAKSTPQTPARIDLTVVEAAVVLRVHEETLRRALRAGKVEHFRLPNGAIRIPSTALPVPPDRVEGLVAEWREAMERVAAASLELKGLGK